MTLQLFLIANSATLVAKHKYEDPEDFLQVELPSDCVAGRQKEKRETKIRARWPKKQRKTERKRVQCRKEKRKNKIKEEHELVGAVVYDYDKK